jgi:hypothetical protein
MGKPEGKIPLRRSRRRWVDHIKMDLRELGWDCVDLAKDRDHSCSCEHGNELSVSLKLPGIS